jgi:hypothetical protein
MKRYHLATILVVFGLPLPVIAQVNPAFSEIAEAAEQARTIAQTERKLVVSEALQLAPEESAAFWPVYDKYAAELKDAGALRVKVITDYAANYDQMSDAVAQELIDDSFKYQDKVLKIRKSYLGKFRKALPETKVARFYQVENKLDALTDFALARQIPLVPQPAASKPIAPP